MERHGVSEESRVAVKEAYRILYRKKLPVPEAIEMIERTVPQTPEVKHLLDFIKNSEIGIVR